MAQIIDPQISNYSVTSEMKENFRALLISHYGLSDSSTESYSEKKVDTGLSKLLDAFRRARKEPYTCNDEELHKVASLWQFVFLHFELVSRSWNKDYVDKFALISFWIKLRYLQHMTVQNFISRQMAENILVVGFLSAHYYPIILEKFTVPVQ